MLAPHAAPCFYLPAMPAANARRDGDMKKPLPLPIEKRPVVREEVYWGIVAPGQQFPTAYFSDRQAAHRALDAMPREARGKLEVVRAYIRIVRYVDGAKPARKKTS